MCGHHPLTHPRTAIRHARAASRLLAEQELDRLCQAAALRDEAKAHLLWSRGGREEGPSPERREAAFATVEKAEAVLGPPSAETDAAFEWLQTRLTRLQFLGATGDAEGVDRVRAETFTRPWVCALLEGSENAALASRLAFVALAAPVASGDLDQVAYAARRFRTDPRSQPYADRVRRAAEMERAAAERDADGVRQAFLR